MSVTYNPIKHIIKRTIQHVTVSLGRHKRRHKEPQLLILMYHRILPADDSRAQREEPGMIVSPESFKLHIEILKKHFEIVTLSKWVTLKNNGDKLPTRACAITFDDGWGDNYEFAFPLLRELEVPATIFLVSDMVNTSKQFWPERLAHIITNIAQEHSSQWSHATLDWIRNPSTHYQFTTVPPTQEELAELIANAKTLSDHEIHSRLDRIENALKLSLKNEEASLLSWQQLADMSASGLIEFASHSCNHTRLNDEINDNLLEHEIIDSKKLIEEKTGQTVKIFCFPNGDYSTKALDLVRQHYEASVCTKTGWNSAATDSYLLQRIGIHEDIAKDKIAFLARISGWM